VHNVAHMGEIHNVLPVPELCGQSLHTHTNAFQAHPIMNFILPARAASATVGIICGSLHQHKDMSNVTQE
jgi:hypothetical protein